MNTNRQLIRAGIDRKDEFITQLVDVENELRHYKHHFKDKIVYCNCDDPRESAFFHYFSYNFKVLGLKKLITTCYKSQNRDFFSKNDMERAIYLEYDGRETSNVPAPEDIGINYLNEDGDFRSSECIELLKTADIIATNPPFSLFREYIAQLIKYDKKFLIIGNQNAITNKTIFNLMMNNKLWLGYGFRGGAAHFKNRIYKNYATSKNQRVGMIRVSGVHWFTNLEHSKRNDELILYKSYNTKDYPHYDNYNVIHVSKVKDIPLDYKGVMSVPITFMDKFNPDQFEIIGNDTDIKDGKLPELVNHNWNGKLDRGYISGNRKYSRIFVKIRNK